MSRKPLSAVQLPGHGRTNAKLTKKALTSLVEDVNFILKDSTVLGPLTLSVDNLLNPLPETISLVYFKLINFCFGVSNESLKQLSLQHHGFENPELLDDHIHRIQLYRLMRRFMKTCLMKDDFSMKDLVDPNPQRTTRNIHAVVNYIKFHYNVYQADETINTIEQKRDELAEMRSEQIQAIEQLETRLSELKIRRKQEHEEEEELKKEVSAERNHMQELTDERDSLGQRYGIECDLKEKSEQRLAGLIKESEKHLLHLENLRRKVVTSPDKLRAHLSRLEQQYTDTGAAAKETDALRKMWESLAFHAHQTPGGILKTLIENLHSLEAKAKKRSEVGTQCEDIEQEMRKQNQTLRQMTAKQQNLLRYVKIKEEESNRETFQEGNILHSCVTEDLRRDVLLLQEKLHKRRLDDERLEQKTEEEMEKLAEQKGLKEAACKEIEEVTQALLTAFHNKSEEYRDIVKTLGLDIFDS